MNTAKDKHFTNSYEAMPSLSHLLVLLLAPAIYTLAYRGYIFASLFLAQLPTLTLNSIIIPALNILIILTFTLIEQKKLITLSLLWPSAIDIDVLFMEFAFAVNATLSLIYVIRRALGRLEEDTIIEALRYTITKHNACMLNTKYILENGLSTSLSAYIGAKLLEFLNINLPVTNIPLTVSLYAISLVASTSLDAGRNSILKTGIPAILAPLLPSLFLINMKSFSTVAAEIESRLAKREGVDLGLVKAFLKPTPGHNRILTNPSRLLERPPSRCLRYILNLKPRHILVAGMTGYGKTQTVALILAGIIRRRNLKVLVIDPHGEYAERLTRLGVPNDKVVSINPLQNPLNPLDHMGLNPLERVIEITQLFRKLFRLGPLQTELLQQALRETYEAKGIILDDPETWRNEPPTISDLIRVLARYSRIELRAQTLLLHVESIWNPTIYRSTVNLSKVLVNGKIVVVDLHNIPSAVQQALYIEALLKQVYNTVKMKGRRDDLELVVAIDEAQLLASKSKDEDVIARYLTELRKYGVMLVVSLQDPTLLSKTSLENISVKIIFRVTEPKIAGYIAEYTSKTMSYVESVKNVISSLERLHALVDDYELPAPVIVKIYQ